MKKISVVLVLFLFLFSGVSAEAGEVMAIVNGEEVLTEEYELRVERLKYHVANMMEIDFNTPEGQEWLAVIEGRIIEELIWETILMQEVRKYELEVSPEKIEEAFIEAQREYTTSQEFENFLEITGFTEKEYRELLHNNLLIDQLLEKKAGEFEPTEEELLEYYENNSFLYSQEEEVAARHLLYEEEEQAKEVLAEIEAGADFDDYMEDGEELGYFRRGIMVSEFEDAVFSMEKGEIKGPVETDFGFHLIYVYDRQEEGTPAFADIREKVEQDLYEEFREDQLNDYFQLLYETSEVEFVDTGQQ